LSFTPWQIRSGREFLSFGSSSTGKLAEEKRSNAEDAELERAQRERKARSCLG
jgi:hypothetical protein